MSVESPTPSVVSPPARARYGLGIAALVVGVASLVAALSFVLLLAVAGWRSLALVTFAVIGVCAVLAGGYWFLAHRGVLRWAALVLVVGAPVVILVVLARASLLWAAVVAVALMVLAAGTARAALSTGGSPACPDSARASRRAPSRRDERPHRQVTQGAGSPWRGDRDLW
jgi:hypothetical protein